MTAACQICCIGSVLWDVIGRRGAAMDPGDDRPGQILRQPGGVALNVAMALAEHGLLPILLSAVGRDPEGHALVATCRASGLDCDHLMRPDGMRTDCYMAIEANGALFAALADASTLEAAGTTILAPLRDGRLGQARQPWTGAIVLDGNLTTDLLAEIAADPCFAAADLRVVPASPGKATRLRPLLGHRRATLYLNLAEADLLLGARFDTAPQAAAALRSAGAARAIVTDGSRCVGLATQDGIVTATPPTVPVIHVTGAGDAFMAAHVAAELQGATAEDALRRAVSAAASHVSGKGAPA